MLRISIVLVGPKGDANIGAVARAMKNFGLTDLRLVDSVPHLTKTSYMWAVEAKDVLEGAKIFDSLDDALADTHTSVTFTRRLGKRRRRHMDVREAAAWICSRQKAGRMALVFGREDKGLSNDEINRCDVIVTIPSSKKLPSLNLAQAVIIACHEIFSVRKRTKGDSKQKFISKGEIARTLTRLAKTLKFLGYTGPLKTKILKRFERLFGRAGLDPRDARMFEGLLTRIEPSNNTCVIFRSGIGYQPDR